MKNNNSSLQAWLPTTPWFFALGVLFWFSSLSVFNMGIDQEIALFNMDKTPWLEQGRWVAFLLSKYIYTQQVLFFFPHLIFILSCIGAYFLILNAYAIGTEHKKEALFLFPLFCAHPFWYLINEFYANIAATSTGLLCCAAALWCYQSQHPINNSLRLGAQAILLAVAIGSYQAFLFLACVLYLGTLFFTTEKNSPSRFFIQLVKIALLLGVGLVLYQLIQKTLLWRYNAHTYYLGNFFNPDHVIEHFHSIMETIFKGIKNTYLGNSLVYRYSLWAYGVLFALGLLVFLIKNPQALAIKLLLVLMMCLAPFSLNFLSGQFYYTMPLRTFIAVPFVAWLFTWFALSCFKSSHLKTLILGLALIGNLQLLHIHANYSSARIALIKHDEATALRVLDRIGELLPAGYSDTTYTLDVNGPLPYQSPYETVISSVTAGSFFTWDDGNPYRLMLYFKLLDSNLHLVNADPAQRDSLKPLYADMPVWPAPGSVRVHEGVILVRFGE